MTQRPANRLRAAGALLVRTIEILARMARHGSAFAVKAAAAGVAGRRGLWRGLAGTALAELFEELGPTYVKLGQILSSRPDLLSPELTRPLARLQSDVAPAASDEVLAALADSFGDSMAAFAEIDPRPVASASVAQVHRARLHDGREVAVKIRRPGIVRKVDTDFRLMHAFTSLLEPLPPMRVVPLRELLVELERPIRQQLDFERELLNLQRLRASFELAERIRLPAPVTELCSESVLTMEFVHGLNRIGETELEDDERREAALAGLRALYKMIFVDGLVHADLHPGNVFLREGGELVMLDTGLVAELGEADQLDFVDFFFGLVNNEGHECARVVWETASYRSPSCDRQAFERDLVALVAESSRLKSSEFEVTRFVYRLLETQRRHGIRGSTKFIMTVLAMVVYDGICKQLHPECDFQLEARAFLVTARYRRPRTAVAS